MPVRQARAADAPQLARLVMLSGEASLRAMFDIDARFNAAGFLAEALCQPEGQFGYGNHWLSEQDGRVAAVISAWHNGLSREFHQATLRSVHAYFGLEHSIDVLLRARQIQQVIPPPTDAEWCIGHLAVDPACRRQGLARQLIEWMADLARAQGKSSLSLDVPVDNPIALNCYEALGFVRSEQPRLEAAPFGLPAHLHLHKALV